MAVRQEEIDGFHEFATNRIREGAEEITFDDLVMEWESLRDREDINAAIREGLADVEAGRHRPASEVMKELAEKYGIKPE